MAIKFILFDTRSQQTQLSGCCSAESISAVVNLNDCSNWSNSCRERDDVEITRAISSNMSFTPSPVLQDVLKIPETIPHCSLRFSNQIKTLLQINIIIMVDSFII